MASIAAMSQKQRVKGTVPFAFTANLPQQAPLPFLDSRLSRLQKATTMRPSHLTVGCVTRELF